MHKFFRLTAAVAALSAGMAFSATSASAAEAEGTATAEILSALSVVETRGLDFAQIAVNGAGVVTIGTGPTPVNTCTPTNLVCAGTKTSARFMVTGAPGVGVVASVRESAIDITNAALDTMSVDTFTIYWPNGTTLSAAGTRPFDVGATLHVAAAQPQGVYTGTYNVDVAYN